MTHITFYGVRGSRPTSHSHYGGHTSCVVVQVGNERMAIDAGMGLSEFGEENTATPLHLFLTHVHDDHIEGLRFFSPIFNPKNELYVYGEAKSLTPQGSLVGIEALLNDRIKKPYFPIPYDAMASKKYHTDVAPGKIITLPHVEMEALRLNHPDGGLGYLLHTEEGSAAFLWDHEHGNVSVDSMLREKLQGVDVVIYDSAYTQEEYEGKNGEVCKKGWGHSTPQEAARLACDVGAQRLFLMHHDWRHSDAMIDHMVSEARKIFPHTEAAQERMQFVLEGLQYRRQAA